MKRILFRLILIVTSLSLMLFRHAGAAIAQVPTKIVTIYNNSKTDTIYPVVAAYSGDVDLWLQAQFGISPGDSSTRTFCNNSPLPSGQDACPAGGGSSGKPPALFRAFINKDKGVLPGESVSINIPFYTQLVDTSTDLGTKSAQYIDWWNAQRIFFYDGKTAINGAYNYNVDQNGNIVSPPPQVTPFAGAAVPNCVANQKYNCETPVLVYYIGVYPTGSIPFQLTEYTFASAEGPPPGGLLKPGDPFSIDLRKTNFNISAVDGVYLPAAMEALLQNDPVSSDGEYLGSDQGFSVFTQQLENFKQNSHNHPQWPYYWPSYFYPGPTTANDQPQSGDTAYPLPSIPSANVVLAESYKVPAPAPPVISSNTKDDDGKNPALGDAAQGIVTLWNKCTSSLDDNSVTCQKVRDVYNFFLSDYQQTCGFSGSPDVPTMMTQVYGWAQFDGCSHALADNPGYGKAIVEYCELQYNYLFNTSPGETFNPYTQLIHKTLKSNAYAFSIDDKAAFKSVPSTDQGTSPGLVIVLGGPKGLINNKQAPLPDAKNFTQYCH